MTTKIAVLGTMSADHLNQATHVHVDLWEVVSAGIKRRLDTYELSFTGASVDIDIVRPAVKASLVAAGAIADGDTVLTQAEAR